jgi:hypothetical protein
MFIVVANHDNRHRLVIERKRCQAMSIVVFVRRVCIVVARRFHQQSRSSISTRTVRFGMTAAETYVPRKSNCFLSAKLSSSRSMSYGKVTILGTDRTAVTCALALALTRHVNEMIVYDPSYGRPMKVAFDDVSEQQRSTNLIDDVVSFS